MQQQQTRWLQNSKFTDIERLILTGVADMEFLFGLPISLRPPHHNAGTKRNTHRQMFANILQACKQNPTTTHHNVHLLLPNEQEATYAYNFFL